MGCLSAQAQFIYTTTNQAVTIKGYNGDLPGTLNIPKTIGGLPVRAIGAYAFQFRYELVSVDIPETVTSIGISAFGSCTSLANVIIPTAPRLLLGLQRYLGATPALRAEYDRVRVVAGP